MQKHQGFTFLELLFPLLVLGLLLTWLGALSRPSQAFIAAHDLKAILQQARLEAIKRDLPIAVTWDNRQNAFLLHADADITTCFTKPVLSKHPFTATKALAVYTERLGGGIIWLPTGQAKACNGTAERRIIINDGKKLSSVTISATGQITVN